MANTNCKHKPFSQLCYNLPRRPRGGGGKNYHCCEAARVRFLLARCCYSCCLVFDRITAAVATRGLQKEDLSEYRMALAAALQQHVGAAELRPVPELPNTIGHLHGQGVQVPPPGLPPLPPSLPGLSAVPPRLDVPPRPPASPLTAAMAPWEAGTPSVTRLGEPHPAGLPSAGGLPQDLAGAALPDLASLGLQPLPALPPPLSGGLPLPPLPPLASLPPPTTDAERRGTGRDATTSGRRHFEGSHMLSLHVHRIHRLHLDRKLTKPCVRVHLISEKTGAHIPRCVCSPGVGRSSKQAPIRFVTCSYRCHSRRRSVGGSLAVDGEAQAAMMEAPGRPDLVGAPVTGERRWQPQLMTYVPAAQTKPRVVYHDEGSGSLRVDYDEELALFHDLQDALGAWRLAWGLCLDMLWLA